MKNIKSLILGALILVAPIQQSQAMLGLASGISGIAVMGAFLGNPLTGIAAYIVASEHVDGCDTECAKQAGFLTVLTGLVLLDNETQNYEFTEISELEAQKRGLSELEIGIYNSELEQVNLILKEIESKLTGDSTVEEAHDLWINHKQYLSDETFKVISSSR